jgi:hypothetical protein
LPKPGNVKKRLKQAIFEDINGEALKQENLGFKPNIWDFCAVRRQNLLDTKWPELRETLAHQVVL